MKRRISKWIGVFGVTLLAASFGAYRWHWRAIPSNLEECHTRLLSEMPKEEIARIKAMTKMTEMIQYHFGAGMWMRNDWGLWAGSPLYWHFWRKGLRHPDDISGYILRSFWCHLHDQSDPDIEAVVAHAKAFYRAHADPPRSVRTSDGARIDFLGGIGKGFSSDDIPEFVHIGRSQKDRTFWAYEWNKGVYAPTGALLKVIQEQYNGSNQMSNHASEVTARKLAEPQR